jgi:hypothetical protein
MDDAEIKTPNSAFGSRSLYLPVNKRTMLLQISGHHRDSVPMFAEIDDADAEAVNKFTWSKSRGKRTTYATTTKNGTTVALHRFIMGLEPFDQRHVNHIDGNGLNNKRSNLEFSNPLHNAQSIRKKNSPLNVGCVYYYPKTHSTNKFIARIKINKKLYQKWVADETEGRIWIAGLIYDNFGDDITSTQ